MFALVWMLGLGGWLGANLTIISMVSAAMIMGLDRLWDSRNQEILLNQWWQRRNE